MKLKNVPLKDIVLDPGFLDPQRLTEVDILKGDLIWDAFCTDLPDAMRDNVAALEQKELQTLRGFLLALITARDAYCDVPVNHSKFVREWAESVAPGVCRRAFDFTPQLRSDLGLG